MKERIYVTEDGRRFRVIPNLADDPEQDYGFLEPCPDGWTWDED